jgi:predicted kinase
MATAHLVHGFLGVGKTTFAKQLERELPAVRFTHDEWMVRFYGSDPPAELFPGYAQNVTEQIGLLWTRCLMLGVDVVLDLGFWTRRERDEARTTARALGAGILLYRVSCHEDVARRRLATRNRNLDGDLLITETTYDILREQFEALGSDEERTEVAG